MPPQHKIKFFGLFAQEEVKNALNYVFMGFIKLLLLLLILGYVCLNNRIRNTLKMSLKNDFKVKDSSVLTILATVYP